MTEDPQWSAWSGETLAECAETPALAINPLIYAEVSIRFDRIEELEDALPEEDFLRLPLPWEAAFLRRRSCSMRRISSRGTRNRIRCGRQDRSRSPLSPASLNRFNHL
jgi:hypothetical protein